MSSLLESVSIDEMRTRLHDQHASQYSPDSTRPYAPYHIDYLAETKRFDVDVSEDRREALLHLDTFGYCVWKNVATEDENQHGHELFWQWAESTYPGVVSRSDMNTWNNLPTSAGTGATWGGGVGTSEFCWYIRTLPKLKRVFSAIWDGEEDLVASLDGCGIQRPTQTFDREGSRIFNEKWVTSKSSFHVDQNPFFKPGRECIQGLYSVFDQDHSTGSLVIVPKSHKTFLGLKELVKDPSNKNDFVNIPFGHVLISPDESQGIMRPKIIQCKGGDLITWDSRTTHFPSPALRDLLWMKEQEKLEEERKTKEKSGGPEAASSSIPCASSEAKDDSSPSVQPNSKPHESSSASSTSASLQTSSCPWASSSAFSSLALNVHGTHVQPRLQRLVSYQCMTPASKIDPSVFQEYKQARHAAVEGGHTVASHWPHSFTDYKLKKRTAKEIRAKPVVLTHEQRALVAGRGHENV